jgi:hypothetical protein
MVANVAFRFPLKKICLDCLLDKILHLLLKLRTEDLPCCLSPLWPFEVLFQLIDTFVLCLEEAFCFAQMRRYLFLLLCHVGLN